MEIERTIQRINKTESWLFEKINRIGKVLVKLTKRKREKTQVHRVRNEKVEITTNAKEIQRIVEML
jgi:hypothetical protein